MSNGLGLSGSSYYILSAIVVVLLLVSQTHGLDISYCSPENNAGSFPTCQSPSLHSGLWLTNRHFRQLPISIQWRVPATLPGFVRLCSLAGQ